MIYPGWEIPTIAYRYPDPPWIYTLTWNWNDRTLRLIRRPFDGAGGKLHRLIIRRDLEMEQAVEEIERILATWPTAVMEAML